MQLLRVQGHADAGKVNRLAAGHALKARCLGQHAAQARLRGGIDGAAFGREEFKGQGLQRVAGQQCLGLAELDVHRGFAAAKHVVVHAGHVVVHQRIRVNQFHRAGGPQGGLGVAANGFAGGHDQQRAQRLPPSSTA
jgi:hypothetical protein